MCRLSGSTYGGLFMLWIKQLSAKKDRGKVYLMGVKGDVQGSLHKSKTRRSHKNRK